jgi:hypothetical protein
MCTAKLTPNVDRPNFFCKQPKGSTISGESHMLPNSKQILPTKMITCGTKNGHWIKTCTWCGSEQKLLTSKKNRE